MGTSYSRTAGTYSLTVRSPVGGIVSQYMDEADVFQTETYKPDRSRDRKATGWWLYPKSYTVTSRTTGIPTGIIDFVYNHSLYQETHVGSLINMGGFGVTCQPWDYTLVTEAEIDALLSVKDSKINLGVAYAEAGKTADMISGKVLQLAKAYRQARKGNFRGAAKTLGGRGKQKTASNWAELQWGWLPVVSDIVGGAQALAETQSPAGWLITGKGNSTRRFKESFLQTRAGVECLIETQESMGAFVRLDFLPGNDFFEALKSLGLGNPAEIAWELVPYSFVVDYLWPIGDWLSSLDASVGLTFLSGSVTRRCEKTGSLVSTGKYDFYNRTSRTVYANSWSRDFSLSRSVYLESPIPYPPPPKNPFSAKKVVNALSLLALAFGKR